MPTKRVPLGLRVMDRAPSMCPAKSEIWKSLGIFRDERGRLESWSEFSSTANTLFLGVSDFSVGGVSKKLQPKRRRNDEIRIHDTLIGKGKG